MLTEPRDITLKEKKCAICSKLFSTGYGLQKYCSLNCAKVRRGESQRRSSLKAQKKNIAAFSGPTGTKIDRICKQCGKPYQRYASQVKHRGSSFCSPSCKHHPKEKTVSRLKKEADAVFSKYIRQRYADPHTGIATCVTCGLPKPWKDQHAGHYEKRSVNSLRFSERNVHVQCVGCNVFQVGNYPRYAQFMLQTYGSTILDELAEEAKKTKQFKAHQLNEIIEEYKAKIEGLNEI